ncbi:hypothetical protein CLAIMM_08818 isoform 1 [Cladophialophora immunda]|nr:hypothetical protein CLAIMM_08818 isoform 1 [Cladophialophora immunda]
MAYSSSQALAGIVIKPITSEADIPVCAKLADAALKPDGLHEFRNRYSKSVYDNTVEKLTDAIRDDRGRFFIFKAVVSPTPRKDRNADLNSAAEIPNNKVQGEEEVMVGFTLWRKGYVEVPKMDPFAPKNETTEDATVATSITNVPISEGIDAESATDVLTTATPEISGDGAAGPGGKPKPFYANPDAELARKLGNAYVGAIRGKRHLCRSRHDSQSAPGFSILRTRSPCVHLSQSLTLAIRVGRSTLAGDPSIVSTAGHRPKAA